MFFSGIADEASPRLERQISAHRELSWKHIELRNVDGKNVTDIPEDAFDRLAAQIEESGLKVSCFASQLANWSRPIDSDFQRDVEELGRAVRRMDRLRVPFVRCMSYPNASPPWSDADWRREAVRRLQILARVAEEWGVTLVHENCSGWGGQGPRETLQLIEDVGSPRLRLVFDTGNPAQYHQDAWSYYEAVRHHVVYVHIKDYRIPSEAQAAPVKQAERQTEKQSAHGAKEEAVFPGEGQCSVREIITDLLAHGYDGGLSIEPHITSVIHLKKEASDPELAYRTYVEYGRKIEALVESIRGWK